jgi:hypothetical protein
MNLEGQSKAKSTGLKHLPKSLTDAFPVRKADGVQVAKIEAIVKEGNQG